MAEVLVQFDEPQRSADGRYFVAQVCGRRSVQGLWEAWIEFHGTEGGDPIRTSNETEQLSRGDLRYWAAGLTRTYLQEALERAMTARGSLPAQSELSFSSFELPEGAEQLVLETNAVNYALPVLDPVAVYRQRGEYSLRQELRALHAQHLRNIIAAFEIPEVDTIDLARTFEDALAERIVAGVQQRVGVSRPETGPRRTQQAQ
jgi:hypothetical protein